MARSKRQQRERTVDDLRDMADALDEAADTFEDVLADVPEERHSATRDPTLSAYKSLMPRELRDIVEAHLSGEHDPETCVLCLRERGELRKGWLTPILRSHTRRVIKELLEAGELDGVGELDEVRVREIQETERKRLMDSLRESGRLREREE